MKHTLELALLIGGMLIGAGFAIWFRALDDATAAANQTTFWLTNFAVIAGLSIFLVVYRLVCLPMQRNKEALHASVLLNAEEKYRSIFENAVMGIFQTTSSGQYLSANHVLARTYGYDSIEDLKASVRDISRQLYVENGRRDEFIRQISQSGSVVSFESQIYRKDGTIRWISANRPGSARFPRRPAVLRRNHRRHHRSQRGGSCPTSR